MTRKYLLFLALFAIVGFITLQIPFTKLAGSNVSFTLFDFFGPVAGAFLGPVYGVISVLIVELVNVAVKQTPLNTGAIIRLFPMLFAVWYFGLMSQSKSLRHSGKQSASRISLGFWTSQDDGFKLSSALILAVPILAILIFVAHPIGRTVWYYSLFWLVPLIAYVKRDWLIARSLGATFTAHAVGGAAWIWAFNLPASVWQGLIPVVIQERLLFALGIAASYVVMRYILSFLIARKLLPSLDSLKPALS